MKTNWNSKPQLSLRSLFMKFTVSHPKLFQRNQETVFYLKVDQT